MQVSSLSLLLFRSVHILKKVILVTFFVWIIIGISLTKLCRVISILILKFTFVNFY